MKRNTFKELFGNISMLCPFSYYLLPRAELDQIPNRAGYNDEGTKRYHGSGNLDDRRKQDMSFFCGNIEGLIDQILMRY